MNSYNFLRDLQRADKYRIQEFNEQIEKATGEISQAKAEEIQRDIDKTQYLKEIRDNTDMIVDQFHQSALKLQEINSVLECIGKDFGDFSEMTQIKNMTTEIYEELAKANLAREKERLDAVQRILKRDLGVPLLSILQEVFAIIIEQAQDKQ